MEHASLHGFTFPERSEGGGMNKLSKGYAVTKVPIVNKLLPLYVRLSHFPCRLLYVLNEFYINKGQLYGNEIAFFQKKIACSRIINTARPTAGRTEAIKRFASHRSSIPFPHSPLHFMVVVAPLVWLCQIHVFPLPPKSCRKRSRNGRSASPATLICPATRLCVSRGSAFHGKFPETSQEPSLRKMPDRTPYITVDKERIYFSGDLSE